MCMATSANGRKKMFAYKAESKDALVARGTSRINSFHRHHYQHTHTHTFVSGNNEFPSSQPIAPFPSFFSSFRCMRIQQGTSSFSTVYIHKVLVNKLHAAYKIKGEEESKKGWKLFMFYLGSFHCQASFSLARPVVEIITFFSLVYRESPSTTSSASLWTA